MPLNPALIYRRTDRGLREVYEKSHQFTQSERLVLILLDGRLSVGALHARLPSLDGDRIERTLAKLADAGLVEPLDIADSELESPSRAEEVLLLEPEVVADFLEQAALDPLTSPGGRVRGEAPTTAPTTTAAGTTTTGRLATSSSGNGLGDSGRSHFLPPRDDDWNPTEATAFAITTINVPDRLDMQEERDRVEAEAHDSRHRWTQTERWMKWLLGAVVLVVLSAVGYAVVNPLLSASSPVRVGERLSGAFQRPVVVASSEFRLSPSPRLVLRGIDIGGELLVGEATLLINWLDFWRAINGGQWVWGEARIAPLTLSPGQAVAALRLLPQAAPRFPRSIAVLRVESVRVDGSRLFPGTYEVDSRRGPDGNLGPLVVRSGQGDNGPIQVEFRPSLEAGAVDFAMQARDWAIPLAMRTRWDDVRASGSIRANGIEVTTFALRGYYGITTGALTAMRDAEWVIAGKADAANIDVETVLNSVARERANARPAEGRPAALQGTANLNLLVAGRGPTLEEAVAGSAVAGPFTVRSAVLNGINLGMVATQGSAGSAGSTRFTEFGGTGAAARAGVRFEDAGGKAGAMVARASFTVGEGGALAGSMRVELGGQRVQAPISLRVSGSVPEPRFGR